MKFPWNKYEEIPSSRRNTLQVFITPACNLECTGCFARNAMKSSEQIGVEEYEKAVKEFLEKGGKQINILGGEPLLHPDLRKILAINRSKGIKTTIYTNGSFLGRYKKEDFSGITLRVAVYGTKGNKNVYNISKTDIPFDANFMVSADTTLDELLNCAEHVENNYDCHVFFISSLRELDNPRKEFFDDTPLTMPLLKYKELIHEFLERYNGCMEIHISKRGVFESTLSPAGSRCIFANYFSGGRIIQCPYDVVNMKFQKDYTFGERYCQQNNACLMSKLILRRKK